MKEIDNNESLFIQLIVQSQQIAMISMGKIKNPVTNKVEKNFEHAKIYIDTLDMLFEKTKGNLSKTEDNFLKDTLKELKLVYVNESGKELI